jgi:hypothetical protein
VKRDKQTAEPQISQISQILCYGIAGIAGVALAQTDSFPSAPDFSIR